MIGKDLKRVRSVFTASIIAIAASAFGATLGQAADLLPTTKAAPLAPAEAPLSPFFVKFGFVYGINTSSSKLSSEAAPGGPEFPIPGVGANIANVATVGMEAGYYVMPNVSLDISLGIPMWSKVTTTGAPIPIAGPFTAPVGTRLSTIMPAFIPITAVYHFNQFGAFQPYVGAGFAPMFSFSQRDGFNTGVTVDPTVGLVLQAGADIMVDRHWGLSFDVKKLFANGTSHAAGDNLAGFVPGGGPVPLTGTQTTQFQPWVLSTGVLYRF